MQGRYPDKSMTDHCPLMIELGQKPRNDDNRSQLVAWLTEFAIDNRKALGHRLMSNNQAGSNGKQYISSMAVNALPETVPVATTHLILHWAYLADRINHKKLRHNALISCTL